jgi:hypothetical protein
MNNPRTSRVLDAVRAGLASCAFLACLTACESAESKRMKALAGDYVYEYASDTIPGREPVMKGSNILTLRPDGKYIYKQISQMVDQPEQVFVDSGAYRINGTTLATSPTEAMPLQRYTISGDSLWAIVSGQIALTKAVTGIDVGGGGNQVPLVRRR